MRLAATLLFVSAIHSAADAAHLTTQMSCAQAQSFVTKTGRVVLYTSPSQYNEYVANRSFCFPGQITRPAFAPTHDTGTCMIGHRCVQPDSIGNEE